LWNAATGTQIGAALTHDREVRGAVFSRDESRILTWSYDRTARLWDAATGAPVGPALPDAGTNAVFSKDETRILTWGDSSARLWDAATGAPIGPALSHDRPVWGAVFSKDETRILTWSSDRTARLWDVSWAMRDASEPGFVQEVCREKLVGASFEVRTTSSSPAVLVGVRHIDTRDTLAAPILRGREGEDVCGPAPTTWDTLVSLLGLRRE
jgi:WD40 repeat protein